MEETTKPQEEVPHVIETVTEEPKVGVIVKEALVDIPVSSGYYKRLQLMLDAFSKDKTPEQIESAKQQIQEQKITEAWVFHTETVLIFCRDFEQKANEAGFVKQMTMAEAMKEINSSTNPVDIL